LGRRRALKAQDGCLYGRVHKNVKVVRYTMPFEGLLVGVRLSCLWAGAIVDFVCVGVGGLDFVCGGVGGRK
jgi:hypothetical protein